MKIRSSKRSGFTLVELLVVISIIVALASIAYPAIMKFANQGNKVKALANAKQIFMAMKDFDDSFQSYPDDVTADQIENDIALKKVDAGLLTGATSNPYFRQLIATNKTDAESLFFISVETDKGDRTREPDKSIANGKALTAGECAYGYIMRDRGDSTSGLSTRTKPSSIPILITCVEEGGNGLDATYSTKPFDGNVIVFRNDGGSSEVPLSNDGRSNKVFPEDSQGRATAQDYKVLKPEFGR